MIRLRKEVPLVCLGLKGHLGPSHLQIGKNRHNGCCQVGTGFKPCQHDALHAGSCRFYCQSVSL